MTDLEAKQRESRGSGVPVRYLATVTEIYPELQGEPYATTITLRPGPIPDEVRRAWYSWTWRAYQDAKRESP